MNPYGVAAAKAKSPAEVLADLRACQCPRGITTALRGGIALTDRLIHHQDSRRALRMPREVPAERLLPALDFARMAPALPSRKHVRGFRLVATAVDWSHGHGPEITGPAEALLSNLGASATRIPCARTAS